MGAIDPDINQGIRGLGEEEQEDAEDYDSRPQVVASYLMQRAMSSCQVEFSPVALDQLGIGAPSNSPFEVAVRCTRPDIEPSMLPGLFRGEREVSNVYPRSDNNFLGSLLYPFGEPASESKVRMLGSTLRGVGEKIVREL